MIAFRRIDRHGNEVVAVCNFTPVLRENYRIGLPQYGEWTELFNSDLAEFGGTNVRNEHIRVQAKPFHGLEQSAELTLPPLSVLLLRCKKRKPLPREPQEPETAKTAAAGANKKEPKTRRRPVHVS